jgi:deoxyguanosine kinase
VNRVIDICGGIAAGKTSFALLFENYPIKPIYEDFKKSPFWEAFYFNPGKYIFETEISFILLHYHQIKKATEQDHTNLICDFSFLLDLAYAKIGLSGSQLNAFECVLNEIQNELPQPDFYIYLECDAETQLNRIQRRKRPEEGLITVDFLESLNNALRCEIDRIDKAKVITINSAEKDFANIKSVQYEMIDLIKEKLPS